MIRRIATLKGASVEDVLKQIRLENWVEKFPSYAAIVVDALGHATEHAQRSQPGKSGRILYPTSSVEDEDARFVEFFGQRATPHVVLVDPRRLKSMLAEWEPNPADREIFSWFMGNSLLDREVSLEVLLQYSRQKLFYIWPDLGSIFEATNLTEPQFIDACLAEWAMISQSRVPSLLQVLDQEKWNVLGRGQLRSSVAGEPATLGKAVDILTLIGRILSQNDLPVKACVIPSVYVLTFNGTIAGDGAVERMLLTGMAGDLAKVAQDAEMLLPAVKAAIRGHTLPFLAASELARSLDDNIVQNTKLHVDVSVLDPNDTNKSNRQATELPPPSFLRYVRP
jgi:hypothetical protein